jgi:hypothetical protein
MTVLIRLTTAATVNGQTLQTVVNHREIQYVIRHQMRRVNETDRLQIDPASATTLMLSPNETVTDFASMLRFADSLLRLARFCCCT